MDQLNKTDTAKGSLKNAADKEKKDLETVNEQYRNQQVLLGNLYPKVDQLRESVFSFAAGLGKTGKTVKDVSGEISAFERAVREEVSALEDADKKTAVHEEAMRRTGRTSKKVAGEITDFNKKALDISPMFPRALLLSSIRWTMVHSRPKLPSSRWRRRYPMPTSNGSKCLLP